MSMNDLELPVQTVGIFLTPHLARTRVCHRFAFNPCPREATINNV